MSVNVLANFFTATVVSIGCIKSPNQAYQLSLPGERVDTLDNLFLQPHTLEIINSTATMYVMIISKAEDFAFWVALFGKSV